MLPRIGVREIDARRASWTRTITRFPRSDESWYLPHLNIGLFVSLGGPPDLRLTVTRSLIMNATVPPVPSASASSRMMLADEYEMLGTSTVR